MDVIDLAKFRDQQADEENLKLVMYDDDTVSDLIFLTVEGNVVFLTHPNERKGVHLTPDQSEQIGMELIRHGAMARYADLLEED